jgi:hypothetical protein
VGNSFSNRSNDQFIAKQSWTDFGRTSASREHVWHFDARALGPTKSIFFNGMLLRDYCERDHTLGYELFKRITKVMMLRLQRARLCILADRVEGES